jgi:uracil phosphoribosyltransferase
VKKSVTVIDHPLIQHKLTIMRRKETSTAKFRTLLREIGMLLAYEITRDMPLAYEQINTPLAKMKAPILEGKKIAFIPILRAGLGFLDGMLRIIPSARVGHIGLFRDPKTHLAIEYYFKVPEDLSQRDVIILDPMLATGHSASAAITRIKELQPRSIKFVSLLAAPEGIKFFHSEHPDVPVFTASIDECLNEHGYIMPGLGDAGDRLFGTK